MIKTIIIIIIINFFLLGASLTENSLHSELKRTAIINYAQGVYATRTEEISIGDHCRSSAPLDGSWISYSKPGALFQPRVTKVGLDMDWTLNVQRRAFKNIHHGLWLL